MRFNNPVLCLIGKSGAGKSTALDMLLGKSGIYSSIGKVTYSTNRPKRSENDSEYRFFNTDNDLYKLVCEKDKNVDIISDQRYKVRLGDGKYDEWRYILTRKDIDDQRSDIRVIASSASQYMDILNYCRDRLIDDCADDIDDHFTPIPVIIDSYDNLRVLKITERIVKNHDLDKVDKRDLLSSLEEVKRREIYQNENVISFKSIFKAFDDYYAEFFSNGEKQFDSATSLYVFNTYNRVQLECRLDELINFVWDDFMLEE